MTEILLKLQEHLQKKQPFTIYSKPGSEEVTGIFQADGNEYEPADYTQKGFIFTPFGAGKTIFIPQNQSYTITAPLQLASWALPEATPQNDSIQSKLHFENLVKQCISAIKSGRFDKLVTSRTEIADNEIDSISLVLQHLLLAYPTALRYCFFSPTTGLWMGATPEQLLKIEGNTLHTVALAGTQLFYPEEPAIWQEKEKQEQLFVTQYITSTLQPFCTNIITTEPYTFRAGSLVHIKTDISAQISSKSTLKDVIDALHPTPAVCGLPKQEAMAFLIENEGYNREYYAGYLGELNHDFSSGQTKTDLFVNLRCMKIADNKAHIYIGCGITADSNPEKEYQETVNKSMTMKRLL